MKISIIINGASRKKKLFHSRILPSLVKRFDVTVVETKNSGHGIELAKQISLNSDVVIAAGGDGTLNEVINGVLQSPRKIPVGIIPLGTGNDFAKMIGVTIDPAHLISLLEARQFRDTDVARVECVDETGNGIVRYSINACSVGMGPEVVKRLMKTSRSLGPTLTYLKTIIPTFFSHKPQRIEISNDSWRWSGLIRVCAIANGQSFGNGIFIAPGKKPDEGKLTACIAGALPLFKFLAALIRLKKKKRINDPAYFHYQDGKSFTIKSDLPAWIETEGELAGLLPVKVSLIPQALQIVR
ncbi:MAG: hypothetical protein HC811_07450 [Flammeovirgaceae bacterium]|nr:hypothetical protein [Flammeovirgaceae bacterium]